MEDSKPAPAIPSGVSQTLIQNSTVHYSTLQYSTVQYCTDLDAAGVVSGEEEVALDVECDAVDMVAVSSQLLRGYVLLKSYGPRQNKTRSFQLSTFYGRMEQNLTLYTAK